MLSSLRIIHPPSSDNPTNVPVLLLNIDSKSYVFNAPEGTTRALLQRGSKGASKRLQGVFLPRVGSTECGGLPGLLMSLADQGKEKLRVFGPPVLSHYLATARGFLRRNAFTVAVHDVDLTGDRTNPIQQPVEIYSDKDVRIRAIPLYPSGFQVSHSPRTDSVDKSRPTKKTRRNADDVMLGRTLMPSKQVQRCLASMFTSLTDHVSTSQDGSGSPIESAGIPSDTPSARASSSSNVLMDAPSLPSVHLTNSASGQAPSLCYIVEGNAIRGKFDIEKAKSLGVPQGKLYSVLTQGQDVQVQRPKEWSTWADKQKNEWLVFLKGQERDAEVKKSAGSEVFANIETEPITIRSDEVVAPSLPGTAFVQTFLPSSDYLDAFFSDSVQQAFEKLRENLHVFVHAVHPSVLDDQRYQAFIRRFPSAHHVLSSLDFVPDKLAYPSSALATLRMSHLDKDLFRVPPYALLPKRTLGEISLDQENVQPAELDTEISLHPRRAPIAVSSLGLTRDFDWPLDSVEAVALTGFGQEAHTEHSRALLRRGRQRWSRYLQVVDQLQEEEMKRSSHIADSSLTNDMLQITTLGTGSALPSKYRNVSATLIHLPHDAGYLLFDAGEGTYGQLCRRFGSAVDQVMRKIRMIFISHIHGDHHMGMARLLSERKKLDVSSPLFVLSGRYVRNYLLEQNDVQSLDICSLQQIEHAQRGVLFLNNEHFDFENGVKPLDPSVHEDDNETMWKRAVEESILRKLKNAQPKANADKLKFEASTTATDVTRAQSGERKAVIRQLTPLFASLGDGIKHVHTALVDHRIPHCYGIVVRGKDWSVAYSGDTRPCESLLRAGKAVDVLIHEATFEDGEEVMAHRKGHSTVGQAIDAARQMGARRILLTHFSQRYPKLPRIADTIDDDNSAGETRGEEVTPSVGIAFDLMTVSLNDIGKTERYREALQILFDDDEDDEEEGRADEGKSQVAIPSLDRSTENGTHGVDRQRKARSMSEVEGSADRPESKKEAQSRLIKDEEAVYVVARLTPFARQGEGSHHRLEQTSLPARVAFGDALQDALEELHGVVGASFSRDILIFQPLPSEGCVDGSKDGVQVVVKCASPFAQTLSSTIASGIVVNSSSGEGGKRKTAYVSHMIGLLNSFSLSTLEATMSAKAQQPPGRAWMESL